ncbi:hypothetical protein K435DRAFT_646603 [Dendrothele bispora CBS 962.96]|uniref:Tc1-like transposase DDE domain-containing protein n=1 Tax=Dendrothele bispora (strain CBS 962.96) TaxID=1314807 RepID=A0A4S8MRQ8_DENBC|nr:hypothetical protein K435DRAFT_646603 [Dendrothele bispora CBS 962.96]
MRHLYFSRKRIHSQAEERNDLERSAWMNMIADLVPNPDMLMFTDEASRNRRTQQRRYGWSLKGTRCVVRQHFVRGQRISILPLLTMDGIVAHELVHGSVTAEHFVSFIREHVIPLTNPYPGPPKRSHTRQLFHSSHRRSS